MLKFKLNDGNEIASIGSGTNTFGKVNRQYRGEINHDTTEIENAIEVGYRRFDTAISYRNESVLALAIKRSPVKREDLFITSKLPNSPEYVSSKKDVVAGINKSLQALETDYIDLYLIHHPWDDLNHMLSVWKVFEEYHQKGILRSIGVSNFYQEQLSFLIDYGSIKPAVNQLESNPSKLNHEIIKFTQAQDILVEAWGPFHGVTEEQKATLNAIGDSYQKTWAQVFLRYQIERNIAVIPKSHNKNRQTQNLDIFDFKLSEDDKELISRI